MVAAVSFNAFIQLFNIVSFRFSVIDVRLIMLSKPHPTSAGRLYCWWPLCYLVVRTCFLPTCEKINCSQWALTFPSFKGSLNSVLLLPALRFFTIFALDSTATWILSTYPSRNCWNCKISVFPTFLTVSAREEWAKMCVSNVYKVSLHVPKNGFRVSWRTH